MARVRLDVLRQIGRVIVHFREQAADHRSCMFRMTGRIPFERAQKLLADGMVVRMTQRAKARGVEPSALRCNLLNNG